MTFEWLVRLTLVGALVEFGLLRIILRFGPFLPRTAVTDAIFAATVFLGTAALNAAVVVGFLAVAAWLLQSRRAAPNPQEITALATAASLAIGSLVWPDSTLALIWSGGLSLTALLFALREGPRFALLAGCAYGAATLSHLPNPWPGAGFWTGVAEASVTGLGLGLFAANLPIRNPARLATGLMPGLALVAGLSLAGFMVRALGVWALGVSFYLPAPLYGAALAGFIWQLIADWRNTRAAGLLLMGLGGLRTDLSYFALLGLAGLLAWGGPSPSWRPSTGPCAGLTGHPDRPAADPLPGKRVAGRRPAL